MPLDTSIALQARPVQFDNPLDVRAKALTLRQLADRGRMQDMEFQQAQEAQQQQRTLGDIYRTSVGADGQPNHTAIVQQMAQQGLGKMIPGYLKQVADADEARAKVGYTTAQTGEATARTGLIGVQQGEAAARTKQLEQQAEAAKFDLIKKKLDASGAALSSLLSRPSVTHQDVIDTIVQMQQQGIIDAGQGFQMTRALPSNPGEIRQFLMQKGLEVMDAKSRIEATMPKYKEVNNGKVTSFVDTNAITNPSGPGSIAMTTTPGEDLTDQRTRSEGAANRGVTIRGQNISASTAAASRDQADRHFRETQANKPAPATPNAKIAEAQEVIALLDQAEPLIATSTSSYLGQGVDQAARVFGASTAGAQSAAQLKALEGALIAKMPKMSGPQSDKDVLLYKQMAGQIGDPTVPADTKRAAMATIRQINERAAGGGAQAAPKGAPPVPVKSDADYNSLPSGTRFQAPDGSIRVKP